MRANCVFCDIINGKATATYIYTWSDAIAIVLMIGGAGRFSVDRSLSSTSK